MTRPRSDRRRRGTGRAERQATAIGADIALTRARFGWTWADVGRRAGVAPVTCARIERGDRGVQLNTLCAIGEAVGLDVVLRVYPGRGPSLRDRGQLLIAQHLCSIVDSRWQARIEAAAGDHGEAVDVMFLGPTEIIAVEIDRLLLDYQERHRRNDQKRRWLAERHQRPVRLVMVVEDSPRNRRAVEPHSELIRTVLPRTTRQVLTSLRTGEPLGGDGLMWIRRRALPPA